MRIELTTITGTTGTALPLSYNEMLDPDNWIRWAVDENWTHDLFLTKEVLYPWATTAYKMICKELTPLIIFPGLATCDKPINSIVKALRKFPRYCCNISGVGILPERLEICKTFRSCNHEAIRN